MGRASILLTLWLVACGSDDSTSKTKDVPVCTKKDKEVVEEPGSVLRVYCPEDVQ